MQLLDCGLLCIFVVLQIVQTMQQLLKTHFSQQKLVGEEVGELVSQNGEQSEQMAAAVSALVEAAERSLQESEQREESGHWRCFERRVEVEDRRETCACVHQVAGVQVVVHQHRAALVVEDGAMPLPVAPRPTQQVELHASLLDELAFEMLELGVEEGAVRLEALVEPYHAEALEAQLVQATHGPAKLREERLHVAFAERVVRERVLQEADGS